jgi:hypothetical protein
MSKNEVGLVIVGYCGKCGKPIKAMNYGNKMITGLVCPACSEKTQTDESVQKKSPIRLED